MEGKTKVFNGNGDVKEFITKVELYSALKGYSGEKSAKNLASKLEGRAFDVYLRLSEGDRKDVNIIKDELPKEFERGQLNHEEALFTLSKRSRNLGESANTYAYKLMELVKLAYPDFDDTTRATLAKDYFVRGLHLDMQIALKSMEKFADSNIDTLAVETTRLQLAGIQSRFEERSSTNAIRAHPKMLQEIFLVEKFHLSDKLMILSLFTSLYSNRAIARYARPDSPKWKPALTSTMLAPQFSAEVLDSIAEKVVDKLKKTSLNLETGTGVASPIHQRSILQPICPTILNARFVEVTEINDVSRDIDVGTTISSGAPILIFNDRRSVR